MLETETVPLNVFVSYSHDDNDHMLKVLQVSNRLRSNGINSIIDRYETSPAEGWASWTSKKVEESDFVIVICSKTYLQRLLGIEREGVGLGATWEGNIISQQLYEFQGKNTKFIPAFLSPEDRNYIPIFLRNVTHYDLSSEDGYESLYRRLTNQPEVPISKIGKLKPMRPRENTLVSPDLPPRSRYSQISERIGFLGGRPGTWSVIFITLLAVALIFIYEWPRFGGRVAGGDETQPVPENAHATMIGPPSDLEIPVMAIGLALDQNGLFVAISDNHGDVRIGSLSGQNLWQKLSSDQILKPAYCVAIMDDLIAAGDGLGQVRLWNFETRQPIRTFKTNDVYVFQLHIDSKSRRLLSAGVDNASKRSVKLWNLSTYRLIESVELGALDRIITADRNLHVVAVRNGKTHLIDLIYLNNSKTVKNLSEQFGEVRGGAFSPDSGLLAIGDDKGAISLWNTDNGQIVAKLEDLPGTVVSVKFHPSGDMIAAALSEGSAFIWKIPADTPTWLERQNPTKANQIAFSGDGGTVAIVYEKKRVKYWKINRN